MAAMPARVDAWFGRDPQRRNEALAQQLFAAVAGPAAARDVRRATTAAGALSGVGIASPHEVPPDQRAFLLEAATDYVQRGSRRAPAKRRARHRRSRSSTTKTSPIRRRIAQALDKFVEAARALGMRADR